MLLTESDPLGLTTETANMGLSLFVGAVFAGGVGVGCAIAICAIAANKASVLHARGSAMRLVMSTPVEGWLAGAF